MLAAKYTNHVQRVHEGDTFIEGIRGLSLHSLGCRDSIGGIEVASCTNERKSGKMGDVDLDFDCGMGVGPRATASPRSTETPRSSSNTARLVNSTGRLGISVSSPSIDGSGGAMA